MPSSDPRARLVDILENADTIRGYVAGGGFERFASDRKTRDAVERCLERICEAARALGNIMDERYPDVRWLDLRRFGSVLRHDYRAIDPRLVWDAITTYLPRLTNACSTELDRLGRSGT